MEEDESRSDLQVSSAEEDSEDDCRNAALPLPESKHVSPHSTLRRGHSAAVSLVSPRSPQSVHFKMQISESRVLNSMGPDNSSGSESGNSSAPARSSLPPSQDLGMVKPKTPSMGATESMSPNSPKRASPLRSASPATPRSSRPSKMSRHHGDINVPAATHTRNKSKSTRDARDSQPVARLGGVGVSRQAPVAKFIRATTAHREADFCVDEVHNM
jgi:hypothetical protein